MKYESIRVLTGTPKQVEKKLNDYFAQAHPNSRLIDTTLSVHSTEVPDQEATAAAAKATAKAGEESSGLTLHGTLSKTVYVETMIATVGRVFPD